MEHLSTTAIHTGYQPNAEDGAVIPPLHLSTTFVAGNKAGYEYARTGNPTRRTLEETLAALDGGKYGLAYSSGSAVLVNLVSALEAGEAVVFSADAYGGTYRYVAGVWGGRHVLVDFADLGAVERVLAGDGVKLIWVETPTNPLLKVADIGALAKLAHAYGAWLVVDNTFATPAVQRPLEHGADVVVYSTTKYMNGHSDSVGGAAVLNDEGLYERLRYLQNAIGAVMAPFDAWLTLRGLRTLELRMERHSANAAAVAEALAGSNKVKQVHYPGLFEGEAGRVVRRQMRGGGGMVSVELRPEYDAESFVRALRYFPLAESLGGVESLVDHPVSMTHGAIPAAERAKIGLSDGLLRLSVGIENTADLVGDVRAALEATRVARKAASQR